MQIGLAQTPGHMLVTNMFVPMANHHPVHPAPSLCQESSSQLKFDYWFLILVPFFMLMALLADRITLSKLNTIELLIRPLEYADRRKSQVVRPGGLSTCLWDRIHLTSNGPLCLMGSNIGNRHLQAPRGTERVTVKALEPTLVRLFLFAGKILSWSTRVPRGSV